MHLILYSLLVALRLRIGIAPIRSVCNVHPTRGGKSSRSSTSCVSVAHAFEARLIATVHHHTDPVSASVYSAFGSGVCALWILGEQMDTYFCPAHGSMTRCAASFARHLLVASYQSKLRLLWCSRCFILMDSPNSRRYLAPATNSHVRSRTRKYLASRVPQPTHMCLASTTESQAHDWQPEIFTGQHVQCRPSIFSSGVTELHEESYQYYVVGYG